MLYYEILFVIWFIVVIISSPANHIFKIKNRLKTITKISKDDDEHMWIG